MKKFLLLFFSLLVGLIAAAPSLLSTHWGKNTLLNFLKSSNYEISLDTLSLSWLGPQVLEGIKVQEKRGAFVFTCPQVTSSAPLWPLLFGGRDFRDLSLVKPNLLLRTSSLGPSVSFMKFKKAALVPAITLSPSFVPNVRTLHLKEGEFSLYDKQELLVRYQTINMDADLPSWRVDISGRTTEGEVVGNFHLKGYAEGDALKAEGELVNFPLQGADALLSHLHPGAEGLILEGLGPSINLSLDGTLSPTMVSCKLLADSPTLHAAIETQGNESSIFLSKPGECTLALSPVFLKRAATLLPSLAHLTSPLNLRLAIDQLNLPVKERSLDFSNLSFSSSLRADPIILGSGGNKNEMKIKNLNLIVKSRKLFDGVTAVYDAITQWGAREMPLHAQALITKKADTHRIAVDIDTQPSPGHLLHLSTVANLTLAKGVVQTKSNFTLSEQEKKWGSGTIVLDGMEIFTEKPVWNFALNALDQEVNIKGALQLKDRSIKLQKEPIEIFFTLNKENFARMEKWLTKKEPLFELSQPSVLALTITSLSVPLEKNWKEMTIAMEGGFDKFAFQDTTSGQQVKMQNLHLTIGKAGIQSPLSFNISSQIGTRDGVEGKLSCIGTLPELNAQTDHPTVDLTMDLVQFPTPILDLFTHLMDKSSIAPLFGERLDATARVRLDKGSGPVELNLKSSNTRLSFVGGVREGILSLTQPAHAQILMTPELSQMLLKEVNPLSISSISSSNPFTLEIDSEGFTLPLNNWRTLSLSHAKIELGQIQTRNEGTLQITLGLLKSREFTQDKQLNLWFAPIDFTIQKGEVALERTEILLNQAFEIATWGNLHLADETVDMVLGLTSQCLTRAFGIKTLPADYVMQIPMKGKMNDVKLDTKSATAKIAALLIWQQSSGSDTGKGLLPGKGFGELLGRLATLPDIGAKAPPAKHPFPWEKYKPNGKERKSEKSNNAPQLKKKNKIHKEDKPLKQLLKILR